MGNGINMIQIQCFHIHLIPCLYKNCILCLSIQLHWLHKMGCCSSCCGKSKKSEDEGQFLSTATNAAIMAKIGKAGTAMKVESDTTKNFFTLSGKGTAIASCMLDCDTGYWEVRVNENPDNIIIGVIRYDPKSNQSSDILDGYLDAKKDNAWYLKDTKLNKGDVVGIYWDQTDLPMLSFSVNGKSIPSASISRIRPANNLFPAISLKNGATCDVIFDGSAFIHTPTSSRFGMILASSSLI